MGCRDMEKCEKAAREIRGSTLNPHVYARHIDLASVKSIRSFAETINQGRTHTHTLKQTFTHSFIVIWHPVIHKAHDNCVNTMNRWSFLNS